LECQIGILTFHSMRDIGALLQSYGLRTYLKSRYNDVDFINYSPKKLTKRYELFPYYPYKRTLREAAGAFITFIDNLLHLCSFLRYRNETNRFICLDLGVTERKIRKYADIGKAGCDCYIMGSDQIWNPDITFGLDLAFFGEFPKSADAKCIAYAASLGRAALQDKYVPEFQKYVENFNAVSLREDSAIPFVKEHAHCPVAGACDPVFLIGKDQWDSIAVTAPELSEHKYLLIYDTENNAGMKEFADRIAKEKNLSVFELKRSFNFHGSHKCVFPGPREFLGLIQNAELVITNSFHGMAFSALFHIPFVVSPHSTLGVRLTDLLRRLELADHLATDRAGAAIADARFDWDKTDKLIEAYRQKSAAFLKDCLDTARQAK